MVAASMLPSKCYRVISDGASRIGLVLPGNMSKTLISTRKGEIVDAIESGASPAEIAEKLGVTPSRGSQIAALRVLSSDQLQAIRRGQMPPAHGYQLTRLSSPEQRNKLFALYAGSSFKWTRAEMQRRVDSMKRGVPLDEIAATVDPNISSLENRLSEALATPVKISHLATGAGEVRIRYHSVDELEGFLDRVLGDLDRNAWS
jgi:hypothetical protein